MKKYTFTLFFLLFALSLTGQSRDKFQRLGFNLDGKYYYLSNDSLVLTIDHDTVIFNALKLIILPRVRVKTDRVEIMTKGKKDEYYSFILIKSKDESFKLTATNLTDNWSGNLKKK